MQKTSIKKKKVKSSKTENLRKKIKATIKRRQNQGWYFDEETLENVNTKGFQYLKSLHDKGYKKLYQKAKVTNPYTGYTTTGWMKKLQNQSRKKDADNTKKKEINEYTDEMRRKMEESPDFSTAFSFGMIIYERLWELEESLNIFNDPWASELSSTIESRIDEVGETAFIVYLGNHANELANQMDMALKYRKGYSYHEEAMQIIIGILNGADVKYVLWEMDDAYGEYLDEDPADLAVQFSDDIETYQTGGYFAQKTDKEIHDYVAKKRADKSARYGMNPNKKWSTLND